MSLTTILLTVSVACNVWFVFLLMYDRIMETRLFRFFGKLAGINEAVPLLRETGRHLEVTPCGGKGQQPGGGCVRHRHGTGNHRQEPFQNDGNPDNDYRTEATSTEATSCHFG